MSYSRASRRSSTVDDLHTARPCQRVMPHRYAMCHQIRVQGHLRTFVSPLSPASLLFLGRYGACGTMVRRLGSRPQKSTAQMSRFSPATPPSFSKTPRDRPYELGRVGGGGKHVANGSIPDSAVVTDHASSQTSMDHDIRTRTLSTHSGLQRAPCTDRWPMTKQNRRAASGPHVGRSYRVEAM